MRSLLLALLCACSAESPESGDDDAATRTSSDSGADASSPKDASNPIDAGDPVDAQPLDAEADAGTSDAAPTGDPIPPTTVAELGPWLQAGSYTSWPAESAPHESTGPHFGRVRTFINTALDESLAQNVAEHPMGAAAVKELYGTGNTIRGWSVMVKTEAGSGGDRWWWYERYDTSTYASSQGAQTCVPCHSRGADFFLSPYPLQ